MHFIKKKERKGTQMGRTMQRREGCGYAGNRLDPCLSVTVTHYVEPVPADSHAFSPRPGRQIESSSPFCKEGNKLKAESLNHRVWKQNKLDLNPPELTLWPAAREERGHRGGA